jgi:hypothetical protein
MTIRHGRTAPNDTIASHRDPVATKSRCAEPADAQDEDLQMLFSTVRLNDQLNEAELPHAHLHVKISRTSAVQYCWW